MNNEYKILIRESHLDSFGHVNNATYLELFEEARWDLITGRGYGLKQVHLFGIGPVILEVNLKFKHELKNRELVTITTEVTSHKGKITQLRQVLFNPKGEEACIAEFTVALFDLKARKIIEPTPEWRQALNL
jgi:acyl-CoA thioester hydrolase